MIWIEVLVEGLSDEPVVREVLQRRFGLVDGVHFRIHPHQGKGNLPANPKTSSGDKQRGLLDQLPAKLRGFSKSLPAHGVVLVLVDTDRELCVDLLAKLNAMLVTLDIELPVLFRLAIEETESWFIADYEAVKKAYPRRANVKVLKGLVPDSIIGAWETLSRSLKFNPETEGRRLKLEWAKNISPHLDLSNPKSPSLKKLIDGVGRLLENHKE